MSERSRRTPGLAVASRAHRALWLAFGGVALACATGPEPLPPRASPARVDVPAADAPPGPPSAALPSAPRTALRITSDGVGDVRVGEPLPARVLASDLASRYRVRWIADAQPFEGFELSEPPVYVHFSGGPMAEEDPIPTDETEIPTIQARLAPRAVERARQGARIVSLLISVPELRTDGDIGVGSSHHELDAAHGPITLTRLPEVLEAKITCDARAPSLPRIRFWLDGCAADAEPGPVKWIWIRTP